MLAIIVLAGAAYVAARLDPPPPPVSGTARASDGDSFRMGEDRVRLLGIDAPELAQLCDTASGGQWACGKAGRERMNQLLSGGKVNCVPEGRDQYQRLLAVCTVGGRDIGATMVAEGLAIAVDRYGREEAVAKAARKGIWQGGFDTPRNWRDDHPRPQNAFGWMGNFWP